MSLNIIYEHYTNVYHFMDKITNRKPNGCFSDSSQRTNDTSWYGTKNYSQALGLFANGIPEEVERLKGLTRSLDFNTNIHSTKSRPKNYYYGYSPNVPAAIIGLPKSMRKIDRTSQKIKAISIYFDGTGNAGVEAKTLRQAGETVYSLIYIMERQGYRVKLDYGAFNARKNNERMICEITLKDWRQPLDMLKLSFPLTHPSMFRRFGFRWAETAPGATDRGWCGGYGRHLDKSELIDILNQAGRDTKNTFVIDVDDCRHADFDPFELAKILGISV